METHILIKHLSLQERRFETTMKLDEYFVIFFFFKQNLMYLLSLYGNFFWSIKWQTSWLHNNALFYIAKSVTTMLTITIEYVYT